LQRHPWSQVGLDAAQLEQINAAAAIPKGLHRQPSGIGSQAELFGQTVSRQRQRQQAPPGPVEQHGLTALAPLTDQGQVTTIPAEARRTVGLAAGQGPEGQGTSGGAVDEPNAGSAGLVNDHRQQAPVTAEGWLILLG